MADPATLREASDRLDLVLRELDAHADPLVRERAREAVELLMEIQGAALNRVLALTADPALGGGPLVTRIADDPLLGPLLTVHGLHPHTAEVRVNRLMERLRGRIAAAGCRLARITVEDGRLGVQLAGWSRLGPDAVDGLRRLLEAVLEVAPEFSSILIEDERARQAPPQLIQIMRSAPR